MTETRLINPLLRTGSQALERQAGLLAEVTQGFASSLDTQDTLRNAIARFIVYLDAEAASVFLLEKDGRELVCHDCAGPVDIVGLRLDATQGIVGKTVRENATQMVRDVHADPDFAASVDAGTGFATRSVLCVPLTVRGKCIGALELINKRSGDGLFDMQDRHLATAIASSAALAIHNARMAAALVEQERVRKELDLARQIQERLLPTPVPDYPITGLNVPAGVVSGDFYDFLTLPDGRIYFSLGDVSGKGMNAALLMAKTAGLLRCLARTTPDPAELLARVSQELCDTSSHGMFVTVVAGFLETESRLLRFANAGHQPPLWRARDGTFRRFLPEAPPIGIEVDSHFQCQEFKLDGGGFYLFSDGVTESCGDDGKPLGISGVETLIDDVAELPPFDRLERIVGEVRRAGGPPRDDITLLVVEVPQK